ncbi:MAG TPA: DUF4291 domain-containing protein [Longimicrobium sp.]|nr:DUF4291 domain-containing protein [Longimicrobium sp.]
MTLATEPYLAQVERWPRCGRHVLAQFDDESVVVYQAYRPAIGHYAARHQRFGGEFSFTRMSWVKTNFLWMMYRSGWGTKPGQEVTLAVRIRRAGFDQLLREAVHSSFAPEVYADHAAWEAAVAGSSVRLQWDPDHDPTGAKVERRAVQLGLRGEVLAAYARDWIVEISDISPFVVEQRSHARPPYSSLVTPCEDVYPVVDEGVATRLGVD